MHPALVRHVILPFHELLLGRGTLPYLRRLEASQWWSGQRLRGLQTIKLRRLLHHAHERCPAYRRWIDAAGIHPASATLNDLRRLPTLTKAAIREHLPELCDPTVAGGLRAYSTGGSTGSPLQFFICRRRQAADQAARARSRRWFGIEVGSREFYLWGSPVEQSLQDRARTLRDRLTNHCLVSAFSMTPSAMAAYLADVRRFDPIHLFGYPSSLARLLRFGREAGIPLEAPSLRAVFVTGEVFTREDRAIIEEAVSVPVADGYGSREGGFVAHQCPLGSYHVTMESHIVELIDDRGMPVSGSDLGEITLTHLDAHGMPFIRYRTGDMARSASGTCPCGRAHELITAIEGRRTDMLRTASGGLAHGLSVIYVLRELPEVAEFKVVQRANLDLDVAIVPRRDITSTQRARIASALRRQLGEAIEVRISLVDRIPPDPSGKHRQVVGPPA